MDTIFDKPLNKELNDKPDYATEMPMSDSDSTTVLQAIANLDGKVSYENTITDLNTATEAGTYYYGANSTNAPTASAGRLIVMKSSESSYGTQITSINSNSSPFIYARSITSSGFGNWHQISFDDGNITPTINSTKITSGTVACIVRSGWAFVSGMNIVFASSGNAQAGVITGLPKAAAQANAAFSGSTAADTAAIRASGDCLWMNSQSNSINVHLGTTYNKGHWFSVSYPVA